MKHVDNLIDVLLRERAHSVTKFGIINGKDAITRVTHRLTRGKLPPPGCALDVVVTTGRPNYRERKVLKKWRKLGSYKQGGTWIQYPPRRRAA